jgi:hypothetical protein
MPAPPLPPTWQRYAEPTHATACNAPNGRIMIDHDGQRIALSVGQAITLADRLVFALHCAVSQRMINDGSKRPTPEAT